MMILYTVVGISLLLSILLGLIRVWRGPGVADRMMAAQLFGTTGVALLMVLAQHTGVAALRDVALVLALLSVLAVVALVTRALTPPEDGDA